MTFQDLMNRWKEKKAREKAEKEAYIRARAVEEGYAQRKLSNSERYILEHQKAEREKHIKEMAKRIQKEEDRKIWSGKIGNPVNAPNVLVNHKNLFKGGSMFSNCPNFFKGGEKQ